MKHFENFEKKINSITKKYQSVLAEQVSKPIEMSIPAFSNNLQPIPIPKVDGDGVYKIAGGKNARLFKVNQNGEIKFTKGAPSGPLSQREKPFQFEVIVEDPSGRKHVINVKVPHQKTEIGNKNTATDKLTIAYMQAKQGLSTAGAQKERIYFRLQDLIDIFKAIKVDNRISNTRINATYYGDPAPYNLQLRGTTSWGTDRETITTEQLKTITDWMSVSWDEHINPSIVNNKYPNDDINRIGYSKGQLYNLGNRIQKISSEQISQSTKPAKPANPKVLNITLDQFEQALNLIKEKDALANTQVTWSLPDDEEMTAVNPYRVPLPHEAMSEVTNQPISELQGAVIIEKFFDYATDVDKRLQAVEQGLYEKVEEIKSKYLLVEQYHSIRPGSSNSSDIQRRKALGNQIKSEFGQDAEYLMSREVFMNLQKYKIQNMIWISGFDDNLQAPPYKELEAYVKEVYIPTARKLQPTARKIEAIWPQLKSAYQDLLERRGEYDELQKVYASNFYKLNAAFQQFIFGLQDKEISRQAAKALASRIAAEQERANRDQIRQQAAAAGRDARTARDQDFYGGDADQAATQGIATAKGAEEQDLYGPDDDAQLSQGERGARDQNLYGPDDDAPLSQGERGARDQDLYRGDADQAATQGIATARGAEDQDLYGPDDDAPLSQGERGARDQDLYGPDDDVPLSPEDEAEREELANRQQVRQRAEEQAQARKREIAAQNELANRNYIRQQARDAAEEKLRSQNELTAAIQDQLMFNMRDEDIRLSQDRKQAANQEIEIRNAIRNTAANLAASKRGAEEQDFYGADDDAPLSQSELSAREEMDVRNAIRAAAEEAVARKQAGEDELANRNFIRDEAARIAARNAKSKAMTDALLSSISNAINNVENTSVAELSYIRNNLYVVFNMQNFKGEKYLDIILDDPEAINEIDKIAEGMQTLITSRLDILDKDVDEAIDIANGLLAQANENTRSVDRNVLAGLRQNTFSKDVEVLENLYPKREFTAIDKPFSVDTFDTQDKILEFKKILTKLDQALDIYNDPFYKLSREVETDILNLAIKQDDVDLDDFVDVLEKIDQLDELVIDDDMQLQYETVLDQFEEEVDRQVGYQITDNYKKIRDLRRTLEDAVTNDKPYTMELFKPYRGIWDEWKAIGEIYEALELKPSDAYNRHSKVISDLISYMPLETLPNTGRGPSVLELIKRSYDKWVNQGSPPTRGGGGGEMGVRSPKTIGPDGYPMFDNEGNQLFTDKDKQTFIRSQSRYAENPQEVRQMLYNRRQSHFTRFNQYEDNPSRDPYIKSLIKGMSQGNRDRFEPGEVRSLTGFGSATFITKYLDTLIDKNGNYLGTENDSE
jgi:hypothetical protein